MKILSLFDGMACGYLAMIATGVHVDSYHAYEIDNYAIQTAQHNFPDIVECGDVFNADFTIYNGYDYLVGGVALYILEHSKARQRNNGKRYRLGAVFAVC